MFQKLWIDIFSATRLVIFNAFRADEHQDPWVTTLSKLFCGRKNVSFLLSIQYLDEQTSDKAIAKIIYVRKLISLGVYVLIRLYI